MTGTAMTPVTAVAYAELIERNAGVITARAQDLIGAATVLVAGCGSIGGAAVEPLARLGVRRFALADPGTYEANNLNRQNAVAADLGRNKAEVAAERVLAINPAANVDVYPSGVTAATVSRMLRGCDLVVDGVDVTTRDGLAAKYLLHEHAREQRLPLFTGWDMAGAQYVRVYDYRDRRQVFDGRLTRADLDRLGLWQLLRRVVPVRFVPLELLTILRANLDNPDFSFPQVVYAADVFGAIAARLLPLLLQGDRVPAHIYVDLHQLARSRPGRAATWLRRPVIAAGLLARLRSQP